MQIENRNFTNFQNVRVRGTGTNSGVFRIVAGGTGTWDSSFTIRPYSGSIVGSANGSIENPYWDFATSGINIGTGYIRYTPAGGSNAGTISVNTTYMDSDRAWQFPNISGTFPIMGTFSVDLPVVASAGYLSTLVTVSGLRAEDGIVITPQSTGGNAVQSARGALAVVDAVPGNGNVTILFANVFATATIARTNVYAYTAVR